MNYYCILVETGKEDLFKKEAVRRMENGLFNFKGNILVFRSIKKIVKKNKIYDEILFPGYVFFRTSESDVRKFRDFSKIAGFLKFLPDNKEIALLQGNDLEIVTNLERSGEVQGFLRAKFDVNDRLTIVDGALSGLNGEIVSVNRRNHKVNMNIVLSNGIKVVNLSYFDVEKEDWSAEEKLYIKEKGLEH